MNLSEIPSEVTTSFVAGEGEEPTNDKSYQYLTTDDVLKMGDDTVQMDTADEGRKNNSMSRPDKLMDTSTTSIGLEEKIRQIEKQRDKVDYGTLGREYGEDKFISDNVNITGPPIAAG